MKKLFNILTLFLAFIISASSLSGCSSETQRKFVYKAPKMYTYIGEKEVAKNDKFTLSYSEDHVIILKDNKSGKVWSSVPYDYYNLSVEEQNSKADLIFRSPVIIEYFNPEYEIKTAYAYENVIPEGTVTAKLIDNGIRIIYFFESPEISIPVEYILGENGLTARLVIEGVREGTDNRLRSVSILPGMAAIKNSESKENYIFVPSGSGALMYTDSGNRVERNVSMPLYGTDPTVTLTEQLNNTEECRLPVFGVRNSDGGLMSVINENSELAYIDAFAGDSVMGYSYVYPTFHVRGTDSISSTDQWGGQKTISIHSENLVNVKYASVDYYPLGKSDSDYVSMANRYSKILFEGKETAEESKPLSLEFYGGVMAKDQFIGISFEEFLKLTTLEDVKEILNTCYKEIGTVPTALLKGFGENGASYGDLCGGFSISKKLGGTKKLKSLKEFCSEKGSNLIVDVDPIFFMNGAKGISTVAKKVSDLKARYNSYNIVTRRSASDTDKPYILAREALADASIEIAEFAEKKNIDYINLGILGNIAYSDYRNAETYCKANMQKDVAKVVANIQKSKCEITSSEANAYIAKLSNCVFDAPINSSKYDGFDSDIPFYQIVFKGKVALTTPSINLSGDSDKLFLKAVESGMGIKFSISKNWDSRLSQSQTKELSFSDYNGIKQEIFERGKEISAVCEATNGASIIKHENNGEYTVTTFSNGKVTVVNFGENAVNTPYGTVEAESFLLMEGGEGN